MDVEFPSSSDVSFEIPSIIEAISSSIDDSRLNFDELEKSSGEVSTESDQMDVVENWSSTVQNNGNYYHNYQQQSMQWNYQQNYSHYNQYGYMTPSPYSSYYMQSPPVDYHQNYGYNNNYEQQPYVFTATTSSQNDSQITCTICSRSFKSSSNLTRHFMSKTHLKRLESKKHNSKSTVIRVKKSKVSSIGNSLTDISKDERNFLWQLDDEIWSFLKKYEEEKRLIDNKNDLAISTPPLSPNCRGQVITHLNSLENERLNGKISSNSKEKSQSSTTLESADQHYQIVNSTPSSKSIKSPYPISRSPLMVKLENGEKFEVVFSDEHL